MSRLRREDDIEFGSDSFLDVVANIVGILIILIVVAGIKAGAAPVSAERVSEFLKRHAAAAPAPKGVTELPKSATSSPQKEIIPPSPDLVRAADALQAELADLEARGSCSLAPCFSS